SSSGCGANTSTRPEGGLRHSTGRAGRSLICATPRFGGAAAWSRPRSASGNQRQTCAWCHRTRSPPSSPVSVLVIVRLLRQARVVCRGTGECWVLLVEVRHRQIAVVGADAGDPWRCAFERLANRNNA